MQGRELIKSQLPNIPQLPGVYHMLDSNRNILYIGKAKNLRNRLSQYTLELIGKNRTMVILTHYLEYIITESESAALLLEAQLIKKFKPKFNILLKDDKSFPFIKLRTDHAYPQLLKYRGKDLKNGKFFGPFASRKQVEITLLELQKIFKLRPCSDSYFANRTRPCLQYQIKKCYGPCANKISKEDYDDLVSQVKAFLSGKNKQLQKLLSEKMEYLSNEMKFEEAAEIRDRIKALSYIQMRATATGGEPLHDTDIITIIERNGEFCVRLFMYRASQPCGAQVYFPEHTEEENINDVLQSFLLQIYQNKTPPKQILLSHKIDDLVLYTEALYKLHNIKVKILAPKSGSRAKLIANALQNTEYSLEKHLKISAKNTAALQCIKELLNLEKAPERIEVYDNSHIQGTFAIGAMIVAGREGFIKKEYRLFTIKEGDENKFGGDDYAMLREVLTRKITRLAKEPERRPDLMIIDGGKGHMKIVKEVLNKFEINLPFVCMSKGANRNAGREQFHMPDREVFTLDKNLPVMKFLQILRDEAHNFAIKGHRRKRSNAIKYSSLDNIPGIGELRKKALLNYFGSFKMVCDATIEELMRVDGINKNVAKVIFEALH